MKNGLLVAYPISNYKNLGDYIQSLAARQFIEDDYCFIEREELSKYESAEVTKVIMNAWYMWHPECWPPKPCVIPLLASMHISPLAAKDMLSDVGKAYLIKHGPVGCRDLDTKKILDGAGVPCYFSACLTLTLGKTYKYKGERKGVIFVDPFIPSVRYVVDGKSIFYLSNLFKGFLYYIKSMPKVNKLVKEHSYFKARLKFMTYYNASMFYQAYSTKFNDDVIFSAEYITHLVPVVENDTNETLLHKSELLIKKYAQSKLVVTSRIHCGLPCLGLETPVIFVLNEDLNMLNAPARFGGLLDFFHIMRYDHDKLHCQDSELAHCARISNNTTIENKSNWRPYASKLINAVTSFMS